LLLAIVLAVCLTAVQPKGYAVAASASYTVTANLYVPGELNTQLPGVTAYLTNGNNPLGLGGYEAVAPTTPVSDNASLTVKPDGTMLLEVVIPNPVFTLQKIGGSSNATIVNAVRDSETYGTVDGSVSREGRITKLQIELKDRSGVYVFTDCTEFPTLLGVDWTVPLTLEADLSDVTLASEGDAVGESPSPTVPEPSAKSETASEPPSKSPTEPSAEVNYDKLNAVIATVDKAMTSAVVSKDGSDVDTAGVWVAPSAVDSLSLALKTAKSSLTSASQATVDEVANALAAAYAQFIASQQSGTKLGTDEEDVKNGRELTAGTYKISANIWFNKADTGLPLNPHITNGTFPPYNPVENNAALAIAEDGSAQVTIPVTIPDKVMTVRSIAGLKLADVKTNEDGAITEITVDMGKLDGSKTVVSRKVTAEIQMGDLAMSISGLDKDHTWPATFELNLSGVATKDGGAMPAVELTMLDASAAGNAMASASTEDQVDAGLAASRDEGPTEPQTEAAIPAEASQTVLYFALTAGAVIIAAVAAWMLIRRHKYNRSK